LTKRTLSTVQNRLLSRSSFLRGINVSIVLSEEVHSKGRNEGMEGLIWSRASSLKVTMRLDEQDSAREF
jgi:hypothetical protein